MPRKAISGLLFFLLLTGMGTLSFKPRTCDSAHVEPLSIAIYAYSVAINASSTSIILGQSVIFMSTINVAPPYSTGWYLNGTYVFWGESWIFTPSAEGAYMVYLDVRSEGGGGARSNTITIVVEVPLGSVYIRTDGSMDPPTAPISTVDNVTYVLNGNITANPTSNCSGIIVERDNIVVSGSGFTIQGQAPAYYGGGILAHGISNVTIQNINIADFTYGIWFCNDSDNSIEGINVGNVIDYGIMICESSNISISGSTITSSGFDGIILTASSNNNIDGNTIVNNVYGISLRYSSSCNSINGNILANSSSSGIWVRLSSDNSISGNRVNGSDCGIVLYEFSNYNNLTSNIITSTHSNGIWLMYSSNNDISGNSVTNSGYGILLYDFSQSNSIGGNKIADNGYGISLISYSRWNSVQSNNVTENSYGIFLEWSCCNTFSHNNFIGNSEQVRIYPSGFGSTWDNGYPSGGNYWSDYNGTDLFSGIYQNEAGSDGIGDTPYGIDESNIDHYPLMSTPNVSPLLGDVNGDLVVDIFDAILLGNAFDSAPGSPNWNPNADINGDGTVDIFDAIILAGNFGATW